MPTETALAIEQERQRQAAAWRYCHDANFHRAVSAARALIKNEDDLGFIAVLDQLAGSDGSRIERLTQLLVGAEKRREVVITLEQGR